MHLRAPQRLLIKASCLAFLVLAFAADLSAQSTLIVVPTRRDMVFDHAGNYLYISTSDGFVRRYNIAAAQLDPGYNLGGSLNGLDIAPNDAFLLVAQNTTGVAQGTFHRVDLSNGNVANINYTRASGETGAWDVAIGASNIALVTTQFGGSGWTPLRQIDLTTNAITTRSDAPGSGPGKSVRQNTSLVRSADASRIYLLDGPAFTYSATTNTFGANAGSGGANAAVNRTGSAVATSLFGFVSIDTAPDFHYLRSFHKVDNGVAFDAVRDRFYGVSSATSQIIAYDATTFAELYRLNIGESISAFPQPFGVGALVASGDGRFLALATDTGVRVFTLPTGPYAPVPTPPFGTARDMVFDHAGQRLYITTAEGYVWPYNLATDQLGVPFDLGGRLGGADIAFDDSYLIVAQNDFGMTEGGYQKLNLSTGAVTNFNYVRSFGEAGAWDVAIGSNGAALATTNYSGSGSTPLREINLTTGLMTKRTDAPGGGNVSSPAQLHRSADGSRMYILESNISSGPLFTYSVTSNTFGPRVQTNSFLDSASAAVNRTGSLLATRIFNSAASLDTAPNFGFVRSFAALTSGVAFDAVSDTLYGVSTYMSQIIAYDTNTFAERFRFDIGETVTSGSTQFGRGLLVASQDGKYLALQTSTAVRVYRVPAVQLLSAASVKTHGGIPFGVDLPLDGPRGVECRSGGANGVYTMVFTFGQNLASVAGATVTSGPGSVTSAMIDNTDPRRYIVNLTGLQDGQYTRVTLNSVIDVSSNQTALISQQMGVLVGDTNGDRSVNAGDAQQTRGRAGETLNAVNFRSDVNTDGSINSGDSFVVRARSGGVIGL